MRLSPGEDPAKTEYRPRVVCLDCPGKLYLADHFDVHLRNRHHKSRVQMRLEKLGNEDIRGPKGGLCEPETPAHSAISVPAPERTLIPDSVHEREPEAWRQPAEGQQSQDFDVGSIGLFDNEEKQAIQAWERVIHPALPRLLDDVELFNIRSYSLALFRAKSYTAISKPVIRFRSSDPMTESVQAMVRKRMTQLCRDNNVHGIPFIFSCQTESIHRSDQISALAYYRENSSNQLADE